MEYISTERITEYFRGALAAQNNPALEFKEKKFLILNKQEMESGQVDINIISARGYKWADNDRDRIEQRIKNKKIIDGFFITGEDSKEEKPGSAKDGGGKPNEEPKPKKIIIASQVIVTKTLDGVRFHEDLEDLTALLFIPARITKSGKLVLPEERNTLPWIPREFLSPMSEEELCIGTIEDYDNFFENHTGEKYQAKCWADYFAYAQKLFKDVTHTESWEHTFTIKVGERHPMIRTDGKYYAFEDQTANATAIIIDLCGDMIKEKKGRKDLPLYGRLINGSPEPGKGLIPNESVPKMKAHVGQMGSAFPLSDSQRECLNHYSELKEGEILAVSGPPGTGKTTLLQSMVADEMVDHALREEKPPIIVAASTNNQAVTNIIDSFEHGQAVTNIIDSFEYDQWEFTGVIDKKWITGTHSFATYFPSKNKMNRDENKRYQCTGQRGESFFEALESKDNREASRKRFLGECNEYFKDKIICRMESATECRDIIHEELKAVNEKKDSILEFMAELDKERHGKTFGQWMKGLDRQAVAEERKIEEIQEKIEDSQGEKAYCLQRMKEWGVGYRKLPLWVRLLKFLPAVHEEIVNWSFGFIEERELPYLKRGMDMKEVSEIYKQRICGYDEIKEELRQKQKLIQSKKVKIEQEKNRVFGLQNELEAKINELKENKINVFKDLEKEVKRQCLEEFSLCRLNESLDSSVRYQMFWLAVHYYEACWLEKENSISEKQKGTTYREMLDNMYQRLAMISPCFVMTFYMLPRNFRAYVGRSGENSIQYSFKYNYIDLLIVDEAGQAAVEIAAPSFALAKKAVVVGDEHQLEPIWGMTRALDTAIAIEKELIGSKEEMECLEERGLNCSSSNTMRAAALSCDYWKDEKPGLFLCEHRRCYNEIVNYCNELVYEGKLKALRGTAEASENPLYGYLPAMGYVQVDQEKSELTDEQSRRNREEARIIVAWVKDNFDKIVSCYQKSGKSVEKKQALGIITPFKAQARLIRRMLKDEIPDKETMINVGTVHVFQGSERNVIIFSSVYGSKDGCYFINAKSNLMNVAVSRAKDSFLLFGCPECLTGSSGKASRLLWGSIKEHELQYGTEKYWKDA